MHMHRQSPIGSGFTAASTAQEILEGLDLHGTSALVTGGYSGLGLATTRALVEAGARVFVPARRPDLAGSRLEGLGGVTVIPMDLADLASVARAGDLLRESGSGLDLVIAAAGVMATPDRHVHGGWERQFAINHLGHFALVAHLLPLLRRAGGARVVSYSSAAHHLSDIRWDDPTFETGYDRWQAYGQSKTANALFAVHLDAIGAKDGIRASSLHPGSIITDLQRDLPRAELMERGWVDERGNVVGEGFKSASQGAATGLWAATAPVLAAAGGVYCEDCDIARLAGTEDSVDHGGVQAYAVDAGSAERLWRLSAEATGLGMRNATR